MAVMNPSQDAGSAAGRRGGKTRRDIADAPILLGDKAVTDVNLMKESDLDHPVGRHSKSRNISDSDSPPLNGEYTILCLDLKDLSQVEKVSSLSFFFPCDLLVLMSSLPRLSFPT